LFISKPVLQLPGTQEHSPGGITMNSNHRAARRMLAVTGVCLTGAMLTACQPVTSTASSTITSGSSGSTSSTSGTSSPTSTQSTIAATAASSSQPTATTAALAECGDAQTTVAEQSAGTGDGHEGLLLTFENTGSSACFVQGYPTATIMLPLTCNDGCLLLDAKTSLQGYLGGDESGQSAPPKVSVQPGQTVSALLEWENSPQSGASTPTAANCSGYEASDLEVGFPDWNNTTSLQVPPDVCWGFYVHPVVPVVANTWQ
jgi:hypothetical protein